jgi:hypothetical protein
MHDLAAEAEQVADEPGDRTLVPGDDPGREDDDVAGTGGEAAVLAHADHRQRGQRLALAAGDEDDGPGGEVGLELPGPELRAVGQAEQAEVDRHPGVAHHSAAHEVHGTPGPSGDVGHPLHARDRRGEAGDEDPPPGAVHDVLERGNDVVLATGEPGDLGVGAVGEQHEDPVVPPAGDGVEVRPLVRGSAGVDLEIAAREQDPRRRLDGEGEAVEHAVGHPDRVQAKRADLDRLARRERPEVGGDAALAQALPGESQGQAAAVDGGGRGLEGVVEGPDVVLVPVGQDDAPDARGPFGEVGEVGDDGVDAGHLRRGKQHPRVQQEEVVLPLHDQRVEPELSESAERNETQGTGAVRTVRLSAQARFNLPSAHARVPRTPQPIVSLPDATPRG